jgi:probable HAF family extracellular repeat protein
VGGYVDSRGVSHGFLYQSGQFTTTDVPHGFYGRATFGSAIWAINDAGDMAGSYTPSGKIGANEGYVDTAGQFTPLAGPAPRNFPTDDIEGRGISNTGVVVGYSSTARGVAHGWLLSGQQYILINDPLANNHPNPNFGAGTSPQGINGHGVVVGWYWDNHGVEHGFMVSTGLG